MIIVALAIFERRLQDDNMDKIIFREAMHTKLANDILRYTDIADKLTDEVKTNNKKLKKIKKALKD